ncbi:MAG: glycosyl hydrolase, partial [Bacteroidota bacterium]
METHSKHSGHIYYANEQELYVSQYIASQLDWREKDVQVLQQTSFPEGQGTRLEIQTDTPQSFRLMLRHPHWAQDGIELRINGKPQRIDAKPGSFLAIERTWQNGDLLELDFPFSLRYEAMPDNPNRIAIFYGPLALAGVLGPEEDTLAFTPGYVPALVHEDKNPASWMSPETGQANTFRIKGIGQPKDIVFRPLYQVHDIRYSVYFDWYDGTAWEKHQIDLANQDNALQALADRTIDLFVPGDETEEEVHQLSGEKLNFTRNFKGRNARGSERGGWLRFEMEIKKGKAS